MYSSLLTTTPLSRRWLLALVFVLASSSACDQPAVRTDAAHGVFVLPRAGVEEHFFDLPWPNDLRRQANGNIDVTGFGGTAVPPPEFVAQLEGLINAGIHGYAANGTAYLRFSDSVDASTLPATVDASMRTGASAFVVNIDPSSANVGSRHPVVVTYREEPTRYWPARCVAIRPVFGAPYEWGTRYAVVLTRDIRTVGGDSFTPDADLAALLGDGGGDGVVEAAREVYADALAELENQGVDTTSIANLAVFTTNDQYNELLAARDYIHQSFPPPTADEESWFLYDRSMTGSTGYDVIEGVYGPSPIFQTGTVPYTEEGGAFAVEAGLPVATDSVDMTFAISIPDTPMPIGGYPVVLYQHGSGGDYLSTFRSEPGVARDLAALGIAAMGVNAIHHGDRAPPGTNSGFVVFNMDNPVALRDNVRQSSLDMVQQTRLIANLRIPPESTGRSEAVVFDPEHVFFYGHSQGAVVAPLALAIDDGARAGVINGAGGVVATALLDRTRPVETRELVALVIGVFEEDEHLVYEHPILTLSQTWGDLADPAAYAHLIAARPRAGFQPKHYLHTSGVEDGYSPPVTTTALAAAVGAPLVGPEFLRAEALEQLGIEREPGPVTANLAGTTTVGLVQFPGDHFINGSAEGRRIIGDFFLSAVRDGAPTISPFDGESPLSGGSP